MRRKASTLLLLTWMPSCLMAPNLLNSSSNCCGVAFNGRLRTYMACASTLKTKACQMVPTEIKVLAPNSLDNTFWILKAATLRIRGES